MQDDVFFQQQNEGKRTIPIRPIFMPERARARRAD